MKIDEQVLDLLAEWQAAVERGERIEVDALCAAHPELSAEVRRRIEMLAQMRWLGGEPDHASLSGNADTVSLDPETGFRASRVVPILKQLGDYELLAEIARGGMGVVYKARQQRLKRIVAVKMILAGDFASEADVQRFHTEAEAAAQLDHPHIVPIYEVGEHGGLHYFSMGFVEGESLAARINTAPLAPREAAELLKKVCHAVHYAHGQGVIHRDLKPGNILLDQSGEPRITDFGLAKRTNAGSRDLTGTGQILGTPSYMPPEQALGQSELIREPADIYALGAILYALLTGRPPFQTDNPINTLRMVVEREPVPPRQLNSAIPLDLETICLKCLEKNSSRRYPSARALADELGRFLEGKPILARPVGPLNRAWRWCKRNRIVAGLLAMVAVSLVVGTVVSSYFAFESDQRAKELFKLAERNKTLAQDEAKARGNADRRKVEAEANAKLAGDRLVQVEAERQKAEESKHVAEAKEAEANAVVRFFEYKVFAAGGPKGQGGGQGPDVSLRNAIAASLPALSKEFADQPLVEARLRLTLGNTFNYLGDAQAAEEQCKRARAIYTEQHGPDHRDTLRSMTGLANSYSNLGRYADALKLCEETLAVQKRVLPPDDPDTLRNMGNLALRYAALGRRAESLTLNEETLAVQKRVLPTDHPDTLSVMHNLAMNYSALGRRADALTLNEETLAARKQVLSPDHPDTLKSMHNLAVSYDKLGRHADALKLIDETLAASKRVLPTDHPDTLSVMHNLAISYYNLRRHSDALKLHEETLAARKRVLPPDHPDTLASMNGLADTYFSLGRNAESLKLGEETFAAEKRVLPPDHPKTLRSMHNLAKNYLTMGRHADALKLVEERFAAQKRVLPPDHPDTLMSMFFVAQFLVDLNRGAEAVPLIDACVAKAAGKIVNPRMIPDVMQLRLRHFQMANDPAGCRATAEMWKNLDRADADSLYAAACFRAVASAVQAKALGADAAQLAAEDAEKAMTWLTMAVAAGFMDRAQMEKEPHLAAVRDREDFKKLLAKLDLKAEKK